MTYICDKRFLLLLMFLDYAVEPFYYERDMDFYEDGQNFALASLLYTIGPTLLGKAEFDGLLVAFHRAVKEKTSDAFSALVTSARKLRWEEIPDALGPLALASPECLLAIANRDLARSRRAVYRPEPVRYGLGPVRSTGAAPYAHGA